VQQPIPRQHVSNAVHARQDAPPVPQAHALSDVTQVVPEQQPLGQLVGSHVQAPLRHRWPVAHGGPPPHVHAPLAQPSAIAAAVQSIHVPPLAPHAVGLEPAAQPPEAQQPEEQLEGSQTHVAFAQRSPSPHAEPDPQVQSPLAQPSAEPGEQGAQAAPPAPHAPAVGGVVHTLPAQHPPGQLVESQMQASREQRWPG
jgi:hypothetical protein